MRQLGWILERGGNFEQKGVSSEKGGRGGSNSGGTIVNPILTIINFPLPGHKLRFSISNI